MGWFSNRTGTSVDDGAHKSNNWLDQWQSGKLRTCLVLSARFLVVNWRSRPSLGLRIPRCVSLDSAGFIVSGTPVERRPSLQGGMGMSPKHDIKLYQQQNFTGVDLGGGCRGCAPPLPEMTWGFLIQPVFCQKKNYVVYWCWSRARDECTPS